MAPLDPKLLAMFLAAGLLLNFTPGPDMLFVLASGTTHGRGGGVRAALGIGAGSAVHTAFAAAGVSAILASSATLFAAVKYAGAAYLLFLGIQGLVARGAPARSGAASHGGDRDRGANGPIDARAAADRPSAAAPPRRLFLRGLVTNVLNPKVALFFLAFMPQFVDASRGHVPLQLAILGLVFCTTGTLVNAAVGAMAGTLGAKLAGDARWKRALDRVTGAVFVALGLKLALAERR